MRHECNIEGAATADYGDRTGTPEGEDRHAANDIVTLIEIYSRPKKKNQADTARINSLTFRRPSNQRLRLLGDHG